MRKYTVLTINGIDWPIDATTRISYAQDSDTTDHPIEDGSEITDHVDLKPLTVDLDGVMSAVPLGTGTALENFTDLFSGGKQGEFVEAVIQARRKRLLVSLDANSRGAWDNLIITSFNPSWSVEDGDSVSFRMSLKQITIVESETATVLSTEANLALSTLQLFSDPFSAVTATTEATASQGALIDSAVSFPGVDAGVDFVAGR